MKADDEQPTFEKIRTTKTKARPNVGVFGMCSGKKSYTKKRALLMVTALKKHGKPEELRVYRCPHNLGHYHLTHMPREIYREHYEARH